MRLAIVATHPIQYYSPVFRKLAEQNDLDLRVFYGWRGHVDSTYDPGFEANISWDIPLLDGYAYEFVGNNALEPGTHHFRGLDSPDLCNRIAEWRAEVIIVYGWSYLSHMRVLHRFHGRIPILFRGDSNLLDKYGTIKNWLRRRWLKYVYRKIDIAVSVGTANSQYYVEFGVNPENIVFAPHAVENARFATNEAKLEGQDLRKTLAIPTDATVIGFSGKLELKKAPEVLLSAFKHCKREDLFLIYFGTGPLLQELSCRGNARTIFAGFVNQSKMPAAYHAIDVLALPSRGPGETWGLAVNEAMTCGKPILCSSSVGCAGDLVHPNTGWVFDSGDLKSLTEVLRNLPDQAKLKAMGNSARELISHWTIEKQVEGWNIALNRVRK